jgi:hypothetical protein
MSVDIGGATVAISTTLNMGNASTPVKVTSSGYIQKPSQPCFIAVGTGDWIYPPDVTWNKLTINSALLNVQSCYNTTLSRFTAPVAGVYFFTGEAYILKDGNSINYYCHPLFYVNGSNIMFNPSNAPFYRIRGHGQSNGGGCYLTGRISQTYRLSVGDYVEYYLYTNSASTMRYYPPQTRFTGVLLG